MLFIKNNFKMVFIFILLFAFLLLSDIGCIFRFFTGIPCPSCGITRAYISLLRLDVDGAFYYHPLFPILLPSVLIMLFMKRPYFNSRILHYIFLGIFSVLVITFWIVRVFFIGGDGFDIDISQAFVVKLYHSFIK